MAVASSASPIVIAPPRPPSPPDCSNMVGGANGALGLYSGPAQGLGKLGLGLRPHQKKKKNSLGKKKAPLFIVKDPNFYTIIYIF